MRPTSHSWYHLVEQDDFSLMQGDVLFQFRYLLPREYVRPITEKDGSKGDVLSIKLDVIILSASCDLDLTNKKKAAIEYITLAPHWGYKSLISDPASGLKKDDDKLIEKGRLPRFCLLAASNIESRPMELRVVDFNRTMSVPRSFVDAHVVTEQPRLRMNAPYREHLAQAFGFCYARIGLPLRPTDVAPASLPEPNARPSLLPSSPATDSEPPPRS